jgi:hypothetical protein
MYSKKMRHQWAAEHSELQVPLSEYNKAAGLKDPYFMRCQECGALVSMPPNAGIEWNDWIEGSVRRTCEEYIVSDVMES